MLHCSRQVGVVVRVRASTLSLNSPTPRQDGLTRQLIDAQQVFAAWRPLVAELDTLATLRWQSAHLQQTLKFLPPLPQI
jgi:hypothetical protein